MAIVINGPSGPGTVLLCEQQLDNIFFASSPFLAPEIPFCSGTMFLSSAFWVPNGRWVDHTPLRLLFSSFNNVLQVTSCFSAANLAESVPCQVLIWVTWRPLDLNFWWVITESEVSNFLISSGSQKGRYFTNHSLEILQLWNVLKFAVCRQKKNLTAQTKRNFLLILAVLIELCWSFLLWTYSRASLYQKY